MIDSIEDIIEKYEDKAERIWVIYVLRIIGLNYYTRNVLKNKGIDQLKNNI